MHLPSRCDQRSSMTHPGGADKGCEGSMRARFFTIVFTSTPWPPLRSVVLYVSPSSTAIHLLYSAPVGPELKLGAPMVAGGMRSRLGSPWRSHGPMTVVACGAEPFRRQQYMRAWQSCAPASQSPMSFSTMQPCWVYHDTVCKCPAE
jgi:hypothetical protein